MAGRTPEEATRNSIDPPQKSISCVTDAVLVTTGYYQRLEPHALTLSPRGLASARRYRSERPPTSGHAALPPCAGGGQSWPMEGERGGLLVHAIRSGRARAHLLPLAPKRAGGSQLPTCPSWTPSCGWSRAACPRPRANRPSCAGRFPSVCDTGSRREAPSGRLGFSFDREPSCFRAGEDVVNDTRVNRSAQTN